jgi:RNA polymerase sigma-70 factor (ECF subfamily)
MADEFNDGVIALIPSMRAYATVLTRSVFEADDLVQEAITRAWLYRKNFQPGTNLKAWLFRILRNQFLSEIQRHPRMFQLPETASQQLSCEPDQEWHRLYGDLVEALAQLPGPGRDALVLVAAAGFSYEEAAELCGCAVGTVKSRVSRAREQLAKIMDYDLPERTPRRRPVHASYGANSPIAAAL